MSQWLHELPNIVSTFGGGLASRLQTRLDEIVVHRISALPPAIGHMMTKEHPRRLDIKTCADLEDLIAGQLLEALIRSVDAF
ncbi:hypothetical protein Vi05172_g3013 [Venturia inaequalis]|nr:hypothetical protein Vi05172_g3013 [Venturia inaequalis]